jgi:hypothetical protein
MILTFKFPLLYKTTKVKHVKMYLDPQINLQHNKHLLQMYIKS